MSKLKAEYKTGGKNRQYVLDKAVKFLTAKIPISQGEKPQIKMTVVDQKEFERLPK